MNNKLIKYFTAANILAKAEKGDNVTEITKRAGNEYSYVSKIVKRLEEKGLIRTERVRLKKYNKEISIRIRGKTKEVTYINPEIREEAKNFLEDFNGKTGTYEEIVVSYESIANLFKE